MFAIMAFKLLGVCIPPRQIKLHVDQGQIKDNLHCQEHAFVF